MNIHKILEDSTRAAILAQVSRYSGLISAKEISKNTDIPLTTVYGHLKTLEENGFIFSTEERVRNLSKKVWQRTSIGIEPEDSRILNQYYQQTFNRDPQVIASYMHFLNALLRENLVKLKEITPSAFEEFQKDSEVPVYVKLYGLTREDYIFVLTKIMELRVELYERAMRRGEKEYQRTGMLPKERYLVSLLAFPEMDDLKELKQSKSVL
ncbi:MAG: winged helix-turn-helix domain-containing protein [Candidatus Hodarchaeota archaeon]